MNSALTFFNRPLSSNVKDLIFKGFQEYAYANKGTLGDNLDLPTPSFEAWDNDQFVGAVVAKVFWGQLHIKYLYVDKAYRKQGIATLLIEKALAYGKEQGCAFSFVETLSFQGLGFYQKCGFILEFTRDGYTPNVSFHYLRKDL